jgi:kynurenine 3-monooxygenase
VSNYCIEAEASLLIIRFFSIELRHLVATPMYLFRKFLDSWLHSLSEAKSLSTLSELLSRELYDAAEPKAWDWLPLYTMVTFRPDISYDQVRRKALMQASILTWLGYFGMVILGFMCWCILRVTWRLFALDASWEVA